MTQEEIFNTDQGSQFTSTEFTGDRIDSSKIELMSDRCLIKNRTENLMRRRRIEEEEVEFGVAPSLVMSHDQHWFGPVARSSGFE